MSQPIRIGIIGAGRIGRVHAENIAYRLPQARLMAVSDVIASAAQQLAAALGIPSCYGDAGALVEAPDIDAVLICSSTDTHARLIAEAAAAGKHIFCEKPIALTLPEIDAALAAVAQSGVKLHVGFNRRFDPSFRRLRELVAEGRIGAPHILRITSRDPQPPPLAYVKVSGGLFLDMAIHDFDMARFLLGQEVTEVFAQGAVRVDPEIGAAGDVDTAVTLLRTDDGALAVIDNSRRAVYGYDQRAEVFGSEGMAAIANNTPDSAVVSDAVGVHGPLPLHFFMERYTESYVAEMRAFLDCIAQDTPPPVSGADGRAAVVIGYAARRSLAENRPVAVTEIHDGA